MRCGSPDAKKFRREMKMWHAGKLRAGTSPRGSPALIRYGVPLHCRYGRIAARRLDKVQRRLTRVLLPGRCTTVELPSQPSAPSERHSLICRKDSASGHRRQLGRDRPLERAGCQAGVPARIPFADGRAFVANAAGERRGVRPPRDVERLRPREVARHSAPPVRPW